MHIENELLSRFNLKENSMTAKSNENLSSELDFFFDNVLDTVVDYFSKKEITKM